MSSRDPRRTARSSRSACLRLTPRQSLALPPPAESRSSCWRRLVSRTTSMSLIALASVKASPGVTTAALALGAVWPVPRQAVVVELDPLGGDLAARFGLAFEPGLLTLAAAVRRKDRAAALQEHVQQLLGKLPVIVGPASPEQAEAAIHLVSERVLSPACEPGDTDVIA